MRSVLDAHKLGRIPCEVRMGYWFRKNWNPLLRVRKNRAAYIKYNAKIRSSWR